MNVDDFIKGENDELRKRQIEEAERKKGERENAKKELLVSLGICKKIYGEEVSGAAIDRDEYPFWDSETWKPYKVEVNVSEEEFERLLEHLKQTDNPNYTKYIKRINRIEKGEMGVSQINKILLTVGAAILFIGLSAVITGIRSDAGYATPGFFAIVLLMLFVLALRVIWKKPKK